jgi:glycosyltransferase involved in cell wall biosynthesis
LKRSILYYSDCSFFAGCENMLANFFNDPDVIDTYQILFMYRWTPAYEDGFNKKVANQIDTIPVRLYDHYDLYNSIDTINRVSLRKPLKILVNLLLIKYLFLFLNIVTLFRIIRKRRVDLLHVNNGGYPGAYSTISMVMAAKLCGISRIVYVVNNIAVGYHSPERWLDYFFDRVIIRGVTLFVTGSNYAAEKLQTILIVPKDKIRCIHNGIAPRSVTETREQVIKRLGLPDSRLILSVIAVLDERKGHIFLLKALEEIKKTHHNNLMLFCIIEGTGPAEALLKKYVEEKNLSNDVLFLSHETQIFNLINASDCIILPSIKNEDFPNIILESMSLGKAIVASNFSGIPEQIEHMKSGFLIEPGNVSSLTNAINVIIEDPELRTLLGKNAKIRFEELFTNKKAINQYCKMYQELN